MVDLRLQSREEAVDFKYFELIKKNINPKYQYLF